MACISDEYEASVSYASIQAIQFCRRYGTRLFPTSADNNIFEHFSEGTVGIDLMRSFGETSPSL
jgi:hypothetical protein